MSAVRFPDLLAVPEGRRAAIQSVGRELAAGRTVAISTHVNPDGDGCGSETALARLLAPRGLSVRIVNPSPWPTTFEFLLGDDVDERSAEEGAALRGIDVLLVVDINDVRRLGTLAPAVRQLSVPRLVIDHHIGSDEPAGDVVFADSAACATGELVFDFATELALPITERVAVSLYTALLTDTGGFRFSNTSPRCHAIASRLLTLGVDPEEMYRRIYASVPVGRLRLLEEALGSLTVESSIGLSWMAVTAGALERHGLRSEDIDGLVEHARSVQGTRLALLFRDLGYGKVKVSFRSTEGVDANHVARGFGGGGHARASGALIAGSLEDVKARVVAAAEAVLRDAPARATSSAAPSVGR